MANTLFDKIWDAHVVQKVDEGPTQLYIDRLYCHEVTSPQAFAGMRARGLKCFRPEKIYCMPAYAGRYACQKCCRFRTDSFRYDEQEEWYHSCGRSGKRTYFAGNDHRVW